jgi:two-component sensor histidine kinase
MLFLTNLTGMALLAVRATAGMALVAIHLGVVFVLLHHAAVRAFCARHIACSTPALRHQVKNALIVRTVRTAKPWELDKGLSNFTCVEKALITLIARCRYPYWIRYTASFLIVCLAFVLLLSSGDILSGYPLLVFIPSIFLSALLLDRGTGIFATFFSAALSFYTFAEPAKSLSIETTQIIPLLLYVAVGCAISLVIEVLRGSVLKLAKAESEKSLLLQELSHRTKNDLVMISSALNLQARSTSDFVAREALLEAVTRVNVIARGRERLGALNEVDKVELLPYVEDICASLGDMLRDVRPIAVRVVGSNFEVSASQAVSIGLIVNELVTNAFKYAFPDGRDGTVAVTLARPDNFIKVEVSDNGIGCPPEADRGLGSKLVRLLASQMGGEVDQFTDASGCQVTVTIPKNAGPQV